MSEKLTPKEKEFVKEYLATGRSIQAASDLFYQINGYSPSRKLIKSLKKHTTIVSKDVYFIRCTETGRFKIGISDSVNTRLASIQATSPTKLEIACVIEYGDIGMEKHFHNLFSKYRFHHEWFNSSPEIMAMVKDINSIICRQ